MSNFFNSLPPLSLAVLFFALIFIIVAALLIWYAIYRNEEVKAKFGHGKTVFELHTKKRRDHP